MCQRLLFSLFVLATLSACGSGAPPVLVGREDAGFGDAGELEADAGQGDAGVPESEADAGVPDAGVSPGDGGVPDAGPPPPPRLETTRCPAPGTEGAATNTVVRIQASTPIAAETVSRSSLRVLANGTDVPGKLEVRGNDLRYVPENPLPSQQNIQVLLSEEVLDAYGRPLAEGTAPWEFVTASGPATVPGFAYSPPQSPPQGRGAYFSAMTLDGERAILAWSSGGTLWGTAADGTSFLPPLAIHRGVTAEQISLAVGGGSVHVGWVHFASGPGTVVYSRADLAFSSATRALAMSPASNIPMLAAGPSGQLAMVWDVHWDYWNPVGGRLITSPDNGGTFSDDASLIEFGAQCPSAIFIGDRLVVSWIQSTVPRGDELFLAVSEDNGASFTPPVAIAASPTQIWCPTLVDNRAGEVLVVWAEGFFHNGLATWVRGFSPSTGSLSAPVQLAPADTLHACSRLAVSSSGKVALVRSRGSSFQSNWVTDVRLSESGGLTFGAPVVVDVIDAQSGCPAVGYTPSGDLYLAWTRQSSTDLLLSRGRPKQPCD
jgi:hypothetical protein